MRPIDNSVFMAVERGDVAAALGAVSRGADLTVFNHEGCTALMAAAFGGRVEMVEALGPLSDPNSQCSEDHALSMTALMLAASEGRADCVALLAPMSDAARRNKMGQTALHLAAYGGNLRCVEILLGACDPLSRDFQGKSALAQAVDSGRVACAQALLAVSEVDKADNSGFSPLSAAVLNQDMDCARLLLARSSAANRAKALASARRRGDEGLAGMLSAYEMALAEGAILAAQTPPAREGGGSAGRL